MHPVLFFQQDHGFGMQGHIFFQQGGAEGSFGFYCRRQLTVVTRQDDPFRFQDRYPAGGLQGLSRLIDNHCPVPEVAHRIVVSPDQRGCHYLRFGQHVIENILLHPFDFLQHITRFVKQRLALFSFRLSEITLVFMGHVFKLTGLLLQLLYLFYPAVLRHPAVQGQ